MWFGSVEVASVEECSAEVAGRADDAPSHEDRNGRAELKFLKCPLRADLLASSAGGRAPARWRSTTADGRADEEEQTTDRAGGAGQEMRVSSVCVCACVCLCASFVLVK